MKTHFQVGAGKTNITPPLNQTRRSGADGLATDISSELHARALVFDDGQCRSAILVLDVTEFPGSVTQEIRSRVHQWTGIPETHVMVCATHTHAAPLLMASEDQVHPGELTQDTQAYLNVLCRQAAGAVQLAALNLKPATAKIGKAAVPGIGRPARVYLKDGSIVSLGSTAGIKDIPPELIEGESPYDDTLHLVVFFDLDGRPLTALGNFGCHNNIALSTTTINSDFFGWAMSRIENDYGGRFVMAIQAGPEGDVQPLARIEHRTWDAEKNCTLPPGRGDDQVPPAGEILYRGILRAWETLEPLQVDSIAVTQASVYFPWKKSLLPYLAEGMAGLGDVIANKSYATSEIPAIFMKLQWGTSQPMGTVHPTPFGLGCIYGHHLAGGKYDERGAFAELQLMRIGELAIAAVCGEVFQETGLRLRECSPFQQTWVASLANDRLCYLMPEWQHQREVKNPRRKRTGHSESFP